MKNLEDIGEDGLIERLLAQSPPCGGAVHQGPGDDCAVVEFSAGEWQLMKTDAVVEGVHFTAEENRRRVGWKAIARVVSDFAAMGGEGRYYLVTLGVPEIERVEPLEELYRGMIDCLAVYGGQLVGGETSRAARGSGLWIVISAVGVVEKSRLVLRSTARVGDRIMVTGHLGGSLAGKHLDFEPRVAQARWLAEKGYATAMMDLSDGLAKDLPRLAKASGCGYELLLDQLPCASGCGVEQAMQDGEDYELLFTVAADRVSELRKDWSKLFPELPLSAVGEMVAIEQSMALRGGWDHFDQGHRANDHARHGIGTDF
jgi:thiamine-monophosphate kinase